MNKKLCKLIMELIFIFIIPLVVIACSFQRVKTYEYDENINLVSEDWKLDWDYPFDDYKNDNHYINYLKFNQLVKNGNFIDNNYWDITSDKLNFVISNNICSIIVNQSFTGLNEGIFQFCDFNIPLNHKLLIRLSIRMSNPQNWQVGLLYGSSKLWATAGISDLTANNWLDFTFIVNSESHSQNGSTQRIVFYTTGGANLNIGDTIDIQNFQIIDLSQMFGMGYEPSSVNEFEQYINLNIYNDYVLYDDIVYYSENSNISENWQYNYSPWGSIINLLINNLYLEDTLVLRVIIAYTILWFIMFLLWHLLYRFVDFMVHLFDKKE